MKVAASSGRLATTRAPWLVIWMLPVLVPMMLAPVIISWSSRRGRDGLFLTPTDLEEAPVMRRQREILTGWESEMTEAVAAMPEAAHVRA